MAARCTARSAAEVAGNRCHFFRTSVSHIFFLFYCAGGGNRRAAVGVAMGNASDDVKAAADYVTADVDDDGLAKAMMKYVFGA